MEIMKKKAPPLTEQIRGLDPVLSDNKPLNIVPFIRWAGGKSWLVRRIGRQIGHDFKNYHEPFLGGGALFLYVDPKNSIYLSDLNSELINAYQQVKIDYLRVIKHLKTFKNTEENYYDLRRSKSEDSAWMAARFIFLNRTSYNGIYRVNRSGEFNVPYGHDPDAPIYTKANLEAVHNRLSNAVIETKDFEVVRERLEMNDLVFLDPPYTVMHSNNGFIAYNQRLFTWEDQERLADLVRYIKKKKAKFIVTNASHESVRSLYSGVGNIIELNRTSTITSKVDKRGPTTELIITNCF